VHAGAQAATDDGERHSLLLQNAETVRLVGPADSPGPPGLRPAGAAERARSAPQDGGEHGVDGEERARSAGEAPAAAGRPAAAAREPEGSEARRGGSGASSPAEAVGPSADGAAPAVAPVGDSSGAPHGGPAAASEAACEPRAASGAPGAPGGGTPRPDWVATAVSELRAGDAIFLLRQAGARHTGIAVREFVLEK